jgi:hypothetical protein
MSASIFRAAARGLRAPLVARPAAMATRTAFVQKASFSAGARLRSEHQEETFEEFTARYARCDMRCEEKERRTTKLAHWAALGTGRGAQSEQRKRARLASSFGGSSVPASDGSEGRSRLVRLLSDCFLSQLT